MSNQGNGRPIAFKVEMSEKTRSRLKEQQRDASLAGKGDAFLAALRRVSERLQRDPTVFGEPLYRLPELKLVMYQGAVLPLLVNYGVHEELPLVFVRSFVVLS